jgi:hypothetical protein
LRFIGVVNYFEDLVARVDAPLLGYSDITFFHQLIFDTPQLTRFISHTPKFKTREEAHLLFSDFNVRVVTLPQMSDGAFDLGISCKQSDWQLSSLAQACSSIFPQALISTVERLYILEDRFSRLRWQDDIESGQWLDLFHPFTAVKGLYISREFTSRIAPTLQVLAGETEVLPALQGLFLEEALPPGPVQEAIGKFVAARQLAGHPIDVSRWERKY